MPYLRSYAKAQHPEIAETEPAASSTPTQLHSRASSISSSIKDTTELLQSLSLSASENLQLLEKNIPVQNLSSLFGSTSDLSDNFEPSARKMAFNKELAEIMTTHIPKFELSTNTNPAIQLRSFIRACKNVLDLYATDNQAIKDFFKLIKFRLGYNVQERITKSDINNLQDFEDHIRSICHIKLNKGKLLSEIRHERQQENEDVSHFVERLRKLIAQGRSEYASDQEFEKEAIRTLKNSVRNELISIKLLDSVTKNFEELAEIAIDRDMDLHQRDYSRSQSTNISQKTLNELLEKIKNLESKQIASIQHVQHSSRLRSNSPFRNRIPTRSPQNYRFCNYCKKPGHEINDCRRRHNMQETKRNNHYHMNNKFPQNYSNHRQEYNDRKPVNTNFQRNNSPFRKNISSNNVVISNKCYRCNEEGHKSNNCFAVICSTCRRIGHTNIQCPESNTRRVHFYENDHNQDGKEKDSGNE